MFSCYSPHILGILNALGAEQEREITTFDGIPYEGSIVNMGVKNADVCTHLVVISLYRFR